MGRLTLLLVALCLLFAFALANTPTSSQTVQVPHELHEHELTDHYGEGRDPRFEGETQPDAARHHDVEGVMKHKPSAATGYYPPPPPPAPPVPPSAKHTEQKAQAAAAAAEAAEEAAAAAAEAAAPAKTA